MRWTISILALVVGLTSVVAQAVILHEVVPIKTYTLGLGAGPIIDVYKIVFHTVDPGDPNLLFGALVVEIGVNAGDPNYAFGIPAPPPGTVFDDPFQAAWFQGGKNPGARLTPTQEDADGWLTPPDDSKCYECDTHFLPAGIATWVPGLIVPVEVNDGSIYPGSGDDYYAGVGNLRCAMAVTNALRPVYGGTIELATVGVVRGTTVWCYTGSADELGLTTKERFLVPEPMSGLLVVPGAVALLRRRRARQRVAIPM